MRHRFLLLATALLIFSALREGSLVGQQPAPQQSAPQQPAPQQQPPRQGNQDFLGPQQPARQGGPGREAGPPRPVPRSADGKVLLGGATTKEKGVWLPGPVVANPLRQPSEVPFQPWARALFDFRETSELEPHTRCKPSGVTRQFLTPYGVEFVDLPELQRLYIFDIGGPHTYRTVYMDGRTHPKNLTPSYYGHSIGWWDGDTLAVDTVGFNEGFWFDRDGHPHTEQLHTIERFTRTDFATLRYDITIDDPGAYTAPWTGRMNLRWERGTELFEYVCQQANYAHELMVGSQDKVDRTSPIIP